VSQSTKAGSSTPVDEQIDPEVLEFRSQFESRSPLDELIREGARRMLQAAVDAEVDDFLAQHSDRRDDQGRRLVVRNGSLPSREILTGAGSLEVSQPRVRDNTAEKESRVTFSPSVLPPYLKRTTAIEELIPWLYLKGVSTGDFSEALQSLVGEKAKGLSANVVVRLKEQWSDEFDEWSKRDLSKEQYIYVWADGIHVKVRLEDEGNKKQCLLVLMGATADGRKELIAIQDGFVPRGTKFNEQIQETGHVIAVHMAEHGEVHLTSIFHDGACQSLFEVWRIRTSRSAINQNVSRFALVTVFQQ